MNGGLPITNNYSSIVSSPLIERPELPFEAVIKTKLEPTMTEKQLMAKIVEKRGVKKIDRKHLTVKARSAVRGEREKVTNVKIRPGMLKKSGHLLKVPKNNQVQMNMERNCSVPVPRPNSVAAEHDEIQIQDMLSIPGLNLPNLKNIHKLDLGYTQLVDKGERQYVVLTDKYDPNTGRHQKTNLRNLHASFRSPAPASKPLKVNFSSELSPKKTPKLTFRKPKWKKHKILKTHKDMPDFDIFGKMKKKKFEESNNYIEYEGHEIVDYCDLYKLINFSKQIPKANERLKKSIMKTDHMEIPTLKVNKIPLSPMKRKRKYGEEEVDEEFKQELNRRQVLKNRWESSLGDKLLLIEQMDSYEPKRKLSEL